MKATDFDSIFEKNFHELTDTERAEMQELFTNEEEFNQMKFVMHSVNATILQQQQKNEPSTELKNRLDHLYTQTYRNKGILWYNSVGTFFLSGEKKWHQQNLLRIAALLILFFSIYPFWNSKLTDEKVQLSKNEQVQEENEAKQQTEDSESPATGFTQPSVQSADQVAALEKAPMMEETIMDKLAEADYEARAETISFDSAIETDEKPVSLTGNTHPDGIFNFQTELKDQNSEFSAARHSDVLDILTATY
ncbi:MAG: hypothetical protein K0R65_887 [Crocinitomicaceae bacterium]|jgi:hypothetical protein|nr:hypothetical protein [Crocinitomicaceae bacterium]